MADTVPVVVPGATGSHGTSVTGNASTTGSQFSYTTCTTSTMFYLNLKEMPLPVAVLDLQLNVEGA